jgi:hypothetical protein
LTGVKYYYICSINRTGQALIQKTIAGTASELLLSGVDEALVKGWADWHGEVLDSKSFQQDETLNALKDTLDAILASNPDGPLKNMRDEDWYSSSLVPASERRRFHWQNTVKRQDQITKIWGRNWGSLLDPSMIFQYSLSTSSLALTAYSA